MDTLVQKLASSSDSIAESLSAFDPAYAGVISGVFLLGASAALLTLAGGCADPKEAHLWMGEADALKAAAEARFGRAS